MKIKEISTIVLVIAALGYFKSDIPYTPKDKFNKMVEENPSLKILQQKLGLDPEY